jgi:hypothetical protein
MLRGYEHNASEAHRMHLGASIIGQACSRRIWYSFHWCDREKHDGRMLRLFQTGHLEEPRLVADLERIGVTVLAVDPGTGKQWNYKAFGGHFGLSLDGAGLGFPEAPKTWHDIEFKTHNDKSFTKLQKDGVQQAKPQHYDQMQVGMRLSGLERAMYIARNKNDDQLYSERVKHDPVHSARVLAKAERILKAIEPPSRISERSDWHECKFCPFHSICHGKRVPEVNCRTCTHSTPVLDGEDGRWTCAHEDMKSAPVLSEELQRKGCGGHRFIPIFLQRTAKPVDLVDGAVVYETPDGGRFANGDGTNATFTSAEMRKVESAALLPDMTIVKSQCATATVV